MKNAMRMAKIAAAAFLALVGPRFGAAAEAPFYQGKTLTILEGRSPGGLGSLRVQIAGKYLQKYLAGNPGLVYQYMPGAGGTMAANSIAQQAKRDGLTIANIGTGVYTNAIFGASGIRYTLDDFVFLGSPTSGSADTLVVRPALGLDTVEKLKAYQGLRFADRSVGHTLYIVNRLSAFVLELKEPKWILGYNDQEITTALARGEADARVDGVPSLLRERANVLKEGYTFPVVIKDTKGRGADAYQGFPRGRPTLDQFADTELKRAVMRLHYASRPGSSVFLVAKGIPEPALTALKEAFRKIWSDRQFIEEYDRVTGEPADPISGEEIDQVLGQMPKDPKILDVYKQLIGAGPVPPAR